MVFGMVLVLVWTWRSIGRYLVRIRMASTWYLRGIGIRIFYGIGVLLVWHWYGLVGCRYVFGSVLVCYWYGMVLA